MNWVIHGCVYVLLSINDDWGKTSTAVYCFLATGREKKIYGCFILLIPTGCFIKYFCDKNALITLEISRPSVVVLCYVFVNFDTIVIDISCNNKGKVSMGKGHRATYNYQNLPLSEVSISGCSNFYLQKRKQTPACIQKITFKND